LSLKIPVGLETTTVKSTLVGEYFSSISVGVNLKLTNFGFSSSAPLAAGGVLTKTSAITHAMLVNIFFLWVYKRNSLKFEGGKLAIKAQKVQIRARPSSEAGYFSKFVRRPDLYP
jgi:hypothetical protein